MRLLITYILKRKSRLKITLLFLTAIFIIIFTIIYMFGTPPVKKALHMISEIDEYIVYLDEVEFTGSEIYVSYRIEGKPDTLYTNLEAGPITLFLQENTSWVELPPVLGKGNDLEGNISRNHYRFRFNHAVDQTTDLHFRLVIDVYFITAMRRTQIPNFTDIDQIKERPKAPFSFDFTIPTSKE